MPDAANNLTTTVELMCGDRPAVLRGAGRDWPVYAALREARLRARDDRLVVAEDAQRRPVTVPLSRVLDELHAATPRGLRLHRQRVSEFDPNLWGLVPMAVRRLNWLLALPVDGRPDWAWLMIGGAGTGSPMHVDTMASAAWNLLCAGRKTWTFHPPTRAEEWHLLPPGCCGAEAAAYGSERWELVQEPGDVVVTPSGWAHEVRNDTGAISITANFINHTNIAFAQRYFELLGDAGNHQLLKAVGTTFARLGNRRGGGSRLR